jgi:SLAP domain-containing protein
MKKVIILNIIIITMFVFIGCNSNDEAIIKTSEMNDTQINDVISEDTELVLSKGINENTSDDEINEVISIVEKGNPNTFHHDLIDTMSFTSRSVEYNDSGEIVLTGIIKNETSHHLSNIRVRVVEIYNEDDELIASECFGYLQANLILKPDESIDWTFTYPLIKVSIKNDDLDYISTIIESSNRGFQ